MGSMLPMAAGVVLAFRMRPEAGSSRRRRRRAWATPGRRPRERHLPPPTLGQSMNHAPSPDALAPRLVDARRDGQPIAERRRRARAATACRRPTPSSCKSIALRDSRVVAWKVGAKSADGPIQGSALPSDAFQDESRHACAARALASSAWSSRSPSRLRPVPGTHEHALLRAKRCSRRSVPRWQPPSKPSPAASPNGPRVAPVKLQLADLQNHGALCVGEGVPYDPSYPFMQPAARFEFNGSSVLVATPRNPAGDPRRLLPWLVNHVASRGVAFTEDIWVTTGSYTEHALSRSGGHGGGGVRRAAGNPAGHRGRLESRQAAASRLEHELGRRGMRVAASTDSATPRASRCANFRRQRCVADGGATVLAVGTVARRGHRRRGPQRVEAGGPAIESSTASTR